MTFARVLMLFVLGVAGVYLFATAPPPLADGPAAKGRAATVSAERMFAAVNAVNAATRKLYTARIVGAGQLAGLKFSESWNQDTVEAGPLPALFLRLVAEKLQRKQPALGLFLGSDEPINPSNLFTGRQGKEFAALRASGTPRFFVMPDGSQVAMFPDIATAAPCVSCHNRHPDTPKKDWKLNDIMGATTWVYEGESVTMDEYRRLLGNLYAAIEEAYGEYLRKAAHFSQRPVIGTGWPAKGRRNLPDSRTLMDAVYASTASIALTELFTTEAPAQALALK